MHGAEHAIAVIHAARDDAETIDVGELLQRDLLVHHLAPDGIRPLLAAADLGVDAVFCKLCRKLIFDALNDALIALAQCSELASQRLVTLLMQPFEG